jgi:hypothetical protein
MQSLLPLLFHQWRQEYADRGYFSVSLHQKRNGQFDILGEPPRFFLVVYFKNTLYNEQIYSRLHGVALLLLLFPLGKKI